MTGPTKEHLVEELAGILWRKRRLRLAEGALYQRGLKDALGPYQETTETALVHLDAGKQTERTVEAIRATPEETQQDLQDLDEDRGQTERALKLLRAGGPDAYDKALAAMRDGTRGWWQEQLEDADEDAEHPYTPDAAGLRRFLEGEETAWYDSRRKELENRPLIRGQAFGEAFDPGRLETLVRYETALDRKLERTLAMLLKLQDLRQAKAGT